MIANEQSPTMSRSDSPLVAGCRLPADDDEERLMIFFVSERAIINSQYIADGSWEAFQVTMRPKLPNGAKIMSVYHEIHRGAFAFVVQHPSFDRVRKGCLIPFANDGLCDTEKIIMRRLPDGKYELCRD